MQPSTDLSAVIAPGGGYGPDGPLLMYSRLAVELRRATGPCLLVGGTGDQFWDGRIARSVSKHVVEIDGADHGMFLPGPLAASAGVLGQVITAVENFLDDTVRA